MISRYTDRIDDWNRCINNSIHNDVIFYNYGLHVEILKHIFSDMTIDSLLKCSTVCQKFYMCVIETIKHGHFYVDDKKWVLKLFCGNNYGCFYKMICLHMKVIHLIGDTYMSDKQISSCVYKIDKDNVNKPMFEKVVIKVTYPEQLNIIVLMGNVSVVVYINDDSMLVREICHESEKLCGNVCVYHKGKKCAYY